MTVIVIAAALLAAAAVAMLVVVIAPSIDPQRRAAVAHLRFIAAAPATTPAVVEQAAEQPLLEVSREVSPWVTWARRLAPKPALDLLERCHAKGGRPAAWPIDRLLVVKLCMLPLVLLLPLIVRLVDGPPLMLTVSFIVGIVAYFLPDLLLHSNGQKRDEAIQDELPDTLDQLLIAVDAGLGFDGAMQRAAANGEGVISEELTRVQQDMQVGMSRRDAFTELMERSTVPDLRRFVKAVLQADAQGISISTVLRTQAAEMRIKRRQRAEEKAQQVPVKIIMPLLTCIMPSLFVVLMGPVAINMVEAFSKM